MYTLFFRHEKGFHIIISFGVNYILHSYVIRCECSWKLYYWSFLKKSWKSLEILSMKKGGKPVYNDCVLALIVSS